MSGRCAMVNTPDAIILADRRVTIKDISEQLGISVGIAQKIVHNDFSFSMVSCH